MSQGNDPGPPPDDGLISSGWEIFLIGVILLAVCATLVAAFLQAWAAAPSAGEPLTVIDRWLGITPSAESRLVLLALLAGGLGAMIHVATSFAVFVGNRTLRSSWIWWYVLRLPIGMSLALIFYFLLRAGLVTGNNNGLNDFGVVAVSALVGMFSKQATDKLRQIFDTIFNTDADKERRDKANAGQDASAAAEPPQLRHLKPEKISVGATGQRVSATGSNFAEGSIVKIGGKDRPTSRQSSSSLTFELLPEDTATAGPLSVTVQNPDPESGSSEALTVEVG